MFIRSGQDLAIVKLGALKGMCEESEEILPINTHQTFPHIGRFLPQISHNQALYEDGSQ